MAWAVGCVDFKYSAGAREANGSRAPKYPEGLAGVNSVIFCLCTSTAQDSGVWHFLKGSKLGGVRKIFCRSTPIQVGAKQRSLPRQGTIRGATQRRTINTSQTGYTLRVPTVEEPWLIRIW